MWVSIEHTSNAWGNKTSVQTSEYFNTVFQTGGGQTAEPGVPAPLEDPNALAELGALPEDAAALVGGNASFFCEVLGNQGTGQNLLFYKVNVLVSV